MYSLGFRRFLTVPLARRIFLIVVALFAAYVWTEIRHQLAHMDEVFFQPSWHGAKALTFYLTGDYSDAAKAYRQHFANYGLTLPDAPEAGSGQEALLRGDVETAKARANKVLKQDAENAEALLDLAEVRLQERDFRRANALLEQVLLHDKEHADGLLLASLTAARSGDSERAIGMLERVLRSNQVGSRWSSFFALLETTGDLARLSSEERPNTIIALYARYVRIFDPSNGRVAVRYAKRAIRRDDRPEEAYLTIGIVHDKEGRKQAALDAFQKAIEANPKYALAYWWASVAYGKIGDLSNEYLMSKAATDAAPGDPFYGQHLTYVLLEKLGDVHQAVHYLQAALVANPDHIRTHAKLAYALDYIGHYDEAVAHYQEAIRLAPKDIAHYEGLASTMDHAERLNDAIATLKRALDIAPSLGRIHTQLGELYMGRYRATEAIHEYEAAVRLGQSPPNLCKAYQIGGQLEQSVECFQRILQDDPSDQYANRNLPEVLQSLQYQRSKRS